MGYFSNVDVDRASVEDALFQAGLLNRNTGSRLVRGVSEEDALLAKWRLVVPGVGMRVERPTFWESRCWPIPPDSKEDGPIVAEPSAEEAAAWEAYTDSAMEEGGN